VNIIIHYLENSRVFHLLKPDRFTGAENQFFAANGLTDHYSICRQFVYAAELARRNITRGVRIRKIRRPKIENKK